MIELVIFDCMVFLQAAGSPGGPAATCYELVEKGRLRLSMSRAIYAELWDVFTRPKTLKRFTRLNPAEVHRFLTRLHDLAEWVEPIEERFVLNRDPKDSKYLNLAIAASARLIVSRDNDLLDLMAGEAPEAETFRANYPNIRILDPVAFLRTLKPELPETSDSNLPNQRSDEAS